MWKLIGKNFLNARCIFPTKQKHVEDMVEVCRQDANAKKAIVFGSSVTAACNPWSDIGIYFELDEKSPICRHIHCILSCGTSGQIFLCRLSY